MLSGEIALRNNHYYYYYYQISSIQRHKIAYEHRRCDDATICFVCFVLLALTICSKWYHCFLCFFNVCLHDDWYFSVMDFILFLEEFI